MKSFNNILVIAEDLRLNQVVLQKALLVAQRAQASLTIIANAEDEDIESHLESIYQLHMASLSMLPGEQIAKPEINIKIKYLSAPFSQKAILTEISTTTYDLLIKDINASHLLWGFSRSDNHYLLREGNTNLLLVGQTQWQGRGNILTALETEESSEMHQEVNQFMVDESQYLAKLLNSDVHLVNCYQEASSIALSDDALTGHIEEPEQQHWHHLYNSAQNFGVQQDHIHIAEGLPEYAIPQEAEKYQADIVTIGAGEHHGLVSALKGHTCEYIIKTLPCDALILKANMRNAH